jgi:hypothetical protein
MKTTRCYLFSIGLLALVATARGQAQTAPTSAASAAGATTQLYGSNSTGETGYIDALAGLAYTDNALLTSGSGKKGDGVAAVGLSSDYARVGMLSLNLLGNVERLQYLNNTYPGSFYGQFNGTAMYGRNTDPLQWQLKDSFGETMTDPLQAPNPLNLQTINDIATGPRLNLHFGLRDRLTLSGQYSRTTYQRSPFDSQTFQGGMDFTHALSGASSVGLQGSFGRTEYLNLASVQQFSVGGVSNFDIWQGAAVFSGNYERTHLLLRAGYNLLDFGHGDRTGEPLYQLNLSRQISPYSTVYLNAESSYSMNGASLGSTNAQLGLQSGAQLNPSLAVAQPFNSRSGSMGWSFQRARTTFLLSGNIDQTLYAQRVGPSLNENHLDEGLSVTLGRELRPRTSAQLWARGYIDRYSQLHAQTRRESFGLSVTQRFFRLAVSFYLERNQQSGAAGTSNFAAASYHDDRVGLYATYSFVGAQGQGASVNGVPGMASFMGGY